MTRIEQAERRLLNEVKQRDRIAERLTGELSAKMEARLQESLAQKEERVAHARRQLANALRKESA